MPDYKLLRKSFTETLNSYERDSLLDWIKQDEQQLKTNKMENELKISKEKVLEAASKCSTAEQTLKVLFPEVFEDKYLNLSHLERNGFGHIFKEKDQYPKVMWVSNFLNGVGWNKRVVFMEKNGKYLSWEGAETLEDSEKVTQSTTWSYARDIEQTDEEFFKEIKKFAEESGACNRPIEAAEEALKNADYKTVWQIILGGRTWLQSHGIQNIDWGYVKQKAEGVERLIHYGYILSTFPNGETLSEGKDGTKIYKTLDGKLLVFDENKQPIKQE